jgi:hypothetical protein
VTRRNLPHAGSHGRSVAVGLLGTLFLHALLAFTFLVDLSLPSERPQRRPGAGGSSLLSDRDPEMTVVFVNETSSKPSLPVIKPEQLASRGPMPLDLPVVVLSPDPMPATEAAEVAAESSAQKNLADSAQHAMLYGRYLGQVQARIERAWMRPRTPIGGPKFYCRTRLTQDSRGYVIEIKLDHCNGDGRWQQSLLSAIRTASPLPAPPDPSVFADRLWLGFMSDAFDPNGSAEGFEPPSGLLAANNPARERLSPEHLSSALAPSKAKDNTNVIHLTIIGNRTYTDSAVPVTP